VEARPIKNISYKNIRYIHTSPPSPQLSGGRQGRFHPFRFHFAKILNKNSYLSVETYFGVASVCDKKAIKISKLTLEMKHRPWLPP
jgi:hypothetical protein